MSEPKIALVYDWVTTKHGGAERVLEAMHQLWPKAPLYTPISHGKEAHWAQAFDVRTSWLQKIPLLASHHRWSLPLLPLATESLDLSAYDVVISISSFAAKGVLTSPNQLHLSYILTPPRFLYSHHRDVPYWQQLLLKPIFDYTRKWDAVAASRPDTMIPISQVVQARIANEYGRETSSPLYPPFTPLGGTEEGTVLLQFQDYLLVVSRMVPYKRIDLVIAAARRLNKQLVIVGSGPESEKLQQLADPEHVQFLSHLSDAQLRTVYNQAQALVMPGVEDFGITGLEALAHGVPIVVHHQSGIAELIADMDTGVYIETATVTGVMDALKKVEQVTWKKAALQSVARRHQVDAFKKELARIVSHAWETFRTESDIERTHGR